MFAMKLTEENLPKIAERCTDLTIHDLKIVMDNAKTTVFIIPDFVDSSFDGTCIITKSALKNEYKCKISKTDWFEVSPK